MTEIFGNDEISSEINDDDVPDLIAVDMGGTVKTPVTVITGLLGSGKTTLLNKLLTATANKKKIAVVLNEYEPTAMNIERSMFIGSAGKLCEQWIEMANGCLCCSSKEALVKVLESLTEKSPVDHVVVESSGLANPAKLINSLWLDEGLEARFELRNVIVVVDASTAREKSVEFKSEWECQLAYADVVIMNKEDLVCASDIEHVRKFISDLTPFGIFYSSTYCNVDIEKIMSLDAFNTDKADDVARPTS